MPIVLPWLRIARVMAQSAMLVLLLASVAAAPLLAQTPVNDPVPADTTPADTTPADTTPADTAALVILDAEGATTHYCVPVKENATGWDLLLEAGVAVNSEPMAMGSAICSINGTGCSWPRQSCFCQCQGSPCLYWSLWTQDETGEWVYANQGASSGSARPGAVQAWVWGDGGVSKSPKPPAIAYADVCRTSAAGMPAAPSASAAASAQSLPVVALPAQGAEVTASAPVTVTGAAVAAVNTNPAAAGASGAFPWTSLLVLLPLPVILLALLFGRRGK